MEFPFSKTERYFTAAEQKHLDAFMALGVQPDVVYHGKKEARRVTKVILPKGLITDNSVFFTIEKTGERVYHTPLAKADGKLALINYECDGKHFQADSKEWVTFAKEVDAEEPVPDTTKTHPMSGLATEKLQRMFPVNEKEMDTFSKGGKWEKPKDSTIL